MKLHIVTQVEENYGAHDWDGTGSCPQYWKMKGGNDYMFDLGPAGRSEEALDELAEMFRGQIEENNDGYREYIIGYGQVADDFLTDFERSQLEYDGEITYPARQLTLEETV
jgi:hypothetical protein